MGQQFLVEAKPDQIIRQGRFGLDGAALHIGSPMRIREGWLESQPGLQPQ